MNCDEAFSRAALYQECAKSPILKHINIETTSIETIRELLNKNNSLELRKIPILFSKFVIKFILKYAKSKFTQLSCLTPENIKVEVESDEMQYILSTESKFKPSLVMMVSKNIAFAVLGSSILALRDNLINEPTEQYTKIDVAAVTKSEWPKVEPPKTFTNEFNNEQATNKTDSDQEHVEEKIISRLNSITSNASNESYSSLRSIKSLGIVKAKDRSPSPKYSADKKIAILDQIIIQQAKVDETMTEKSEEPFKNSTIESNIIKDSGDENTENRDHQDFDNPINTNEIENNNIKKHVLSSLIQSNENIIKPEDIDEYDDDEDEMYSDFENENNNESEFSDNELSDKPIKLSDVEESNLKPNAADYFSLIKGTISPIRGSSPIRQTSTPLPIPDKITIEPQNDPDIDEIIELDDDEEKIRKITPQNHIDIDKDSDNDDDDDDDDIL